MHNSTNELFSPFLIISFENLPPDIICKLSIIRVLPAPVSPVSTFSPSFKFIFISSIIPIFLICKDVIILKPQLSFYTKKMFAFILSSNLKFVNSFCEHFFFFIFDSFVLTSILFYYILKYIHPLMQMFQIYDAHLPLFL